MLDYKVNILLILNYWKYNLHKEGNAEGIYSSESCRKKEERDSRFFY